MSTNQSKLPVILITGKSGQVGFELQRALSTVGEVVALGHADCDLADEQALRRIVQQIRPDIIVNPAAYTAVDKAEKEADLAYAINARAPGVLGEEAVKLGAWVIHFSTDYVFDGEKSGADAESASYQENDQTNPQNVYGQTKLDGELALAASGARHVIFRTSWVVGAHGANFAKTMLRLAAERDSLNVVADQYGAPTSAALLADLTAQVIRQAQIKGLDDFPFGIYHVSGSGETNWCDYARFVIAEAHKAGKRLKTMPENVHPIAASSYPTPAKRPTNSRLNTQKFRAAFGLTIPDWQQSVSHILKQIG